MTATDPRPVDVARLFHEAYERLAPSFGYETRRDSAVPWESVPLMNKRLMIAVAAEVLAALAQVPPSGRVLPAATCPCCGSAVRVHTADEGTCSYEPAVSADAIETVRELLDDAKSWIENYPLSASSVDYLADWSALAARCKAILEALPPKADGPTTEPRIRTIGDLTRAMTEAGLEPPDECA